MKETNSYLTTIEFLDRLDQLLATSDKWTQLVNARTKKGTITTTSNRYAYSFCLSGGVCKVGQSFTPNPGLYENKARYYLQQATVEAMYPLANYSFIGYNDHHTFEEVKALIKRAREICMEDYEKDQNARRRTNG